MPPGQFNVIFDDSLLEVDFFEASDCDVQNNGASRRPTTVESTEYFGIALREFVQGRHTQ
jgi:hypothetical protein